MFFGVDNIKGQINYLLYLFFYVIIAKQDVEMLKIIIELM